ncbi:hypothetical protein BDV23DRAFT_163756 [Aspergillus alliaceus]|uniref:Uncharacterized protein n=1 Tax=Petromyces alliaceus TaxID=209559 RepID=A0A5N7BWG2_PETAA|nr:hypothetical protein BDV23DRAFT_163756 [Aspergillus alliaceus]
MLRLAAVEYPLKVGDGIILMGYSTALVPIRTVNDSVIWHLEVAGHSSQLTVEELIATKEEWLKASTLEDFIGKEALIGWCPEASIALGTDKMDLDTIGWSTAAQKKTTWHWAGANLQILAQSAAPIQIGGQLGISMQRTVNAVRFSPSRNFLKCLNSSAGEQIILYDVNAKRAWLVPLLSVFHHMLSVYGHSIPEPSRASRVPLGKPAVDGGFMSHQVLRDKGESVIEISDGDRCTVRDLIMGFSANMAKISNHPPRGSEVYGYEFMDIVMDSPLAELKKQKIEKRGLGWVPLLHQIRCLFCSHLGDAILGARSVQHNSICNRVPHGSDLMAATIRGIRALSKQSGAVTESSVCRLSGKHVWTLVGDPFTQCQHKTSSKSSCWVTMQFLQEIHLERSGSSPPPLQQLDWRSEGAVVFGRRPSQTSPFSKIKPV